jgi:hypothetical protein
MHLRAIYRETSIANHRWFLKPRPIGRSWSGAGHDDRQRARRVYVGRHRGDRVVVRLHSRHGIAGAVPLKVTAQNG